jgi:hypothetical protein
MLHGQALADETPSPGKAAASWLCCTGKAAKVGSRTWVLAGQVLPWEHTRRAIGCMDLPALLTSAAPA